MFPILKTLILLYLLGTGKEGKGGIQINRLIKFFLGTVECGENTELHNRPGCPGGTKAEKTGSLPDIPDIPPST